MLALLQDWIEIEGSGNVDIIQSATNWRDVTGHQDIVFWLDVRMITSVATELTLHYETAPTLEPTLFTDMTTGISMLGAFGSTPVVTKVLLSQNPTMPPSGLVRWRISAVAGGAWKVNFRIHCLAKRG